jgi:hypothetical protein
MFKSVVFCAAVALLTLTGLAVRASSEGDAVSIELKAFNFKVPEAMKGLFGLNEDEGKLFFYTNGTAEAPFKLPKDGDYEIVIKASGEPAQNERAKFKLLVDGKEFGKETVLTADEAKEYTLSGALKAGEHKLSVEYTNDIFKENEYDRNFYLHGVTVKPAKK